jgi:hypothetical protein
MSPIFNLVIFIFIGHSNMQGFCAAMDTVPDPHVWGYSLQKGFYNITDKDRAVQHGSPLIPFLKRMALLYPGYNFCGIEHDQPGLMAWDVLHEGRHKVCIANQINQVKKFGAFGGMLLMCGNSEGQDRNRLDSMEIDILELVHFVRAQTGVKDLPIVLGRYETNYKRIQYSPEVLAAINKLPAATRKGIMSKEFTYFHRNDNVIDQKISSMPFRDHHVVLAPFEPIPGGNYCDDHHYDAEGYQIWATDAASRLWLNHWDAWKR